MGSKSKQKGSAFERDVCVRLSGWLSRGERKDLFWRSAMSGGRATVALKARESTLKAQAGDISTVTGQGELFTSIFCIEAKHYAELKFHAAVMQRAGTVPTIIKFWHEAKFDAAQHEKIPMLIAKQNNYPAMMGTTTQAMRYLKLYDWSVHFVDYELCFVLFDMFLGSTPDTFIKRHKLFDKLRTVL